MYWEQPVQFASQSDVGLRRDNNEDSSVVRLAADEKSFREHGHLLGVDLEPVASGRAWCRDVDPRRGSRTAEAWHEGVGLHGCRLAPALPAGLEGAMAAPLEVRDA